MTHEEYIAKRNGLLEQAQTHANALENEQARSIIEQVNALDADFAEAAEMSNQLAVAAANAVAMAGPAKITNALGVEDSFDAENKKANTYLNVFAKYAMRKPLTTEENAVFAQHNNAYVHTTGNTGAVIPDELAKGIFEDVAEVYPLWKDVGKTYVKGKLTIPVSTASTDAEWYDEDTATEDGTETLVEITLDGCELSRSITVSWKLQEMAVEEFIPFIRKKLADKMGAALGYGTSHGRGAAGETDEWKDEPLGVITKIEREAADTVIEYTDADPLTYAKLAKARAKINSRFAKSLCVYVNGATLWDDVAAVVDGIGRPMFVPNVANGGVGNILGMTVKEDSSLADGEILIGNATEGYIANVNKDLTLDMEDHKKQRNTDYIGYAIVDGKPTSLKAWALLKKG